MKLERQLDTLSTCGVRLAPGRTIAELLVSFDRKAYEAEPFALAITMLGAEVEAEPWDRLFSKDVWHFDTECVEDHGAYVAISQRLAVLAQGDLPLENVKDYVDVEAGKAWVEFSVGSQSYHWDAKVEDDWVDPSILSRFAKLLSDKGKGRRFTYLDLGGQDCIIGAATPSQLECLRKKTGQNFVWLK